MSKFKVRVYLSTFVDVEVEAENEHEATEYVEQNSDSWFAAGNQILENVALQEGETQVEPLDEELWFEAAN